MVLYYKLKQLEQKKINLNIFGVNIFNHWNYFFYDKKIKKIEGKIFQLKNIYEELILLIYKYEWIKNNIILIIYF